MLKRSAHTTQLVIKTTAVIVSAGILSYLLLFIFWHIVTRSFFGINYFDRDWLIDWYTIRNQFLTDFMFFITLFGADLTIVLGTIVTFFFKREEHRREAVIFGISGLSGFVLSIVLKYIFARSRPDLSPLISMDSFSYPSGHAMNAFIFYGLLSYYLIVFTKRRILEVIVAVICVSMILLIGASRIYLGVHYPTDVFAGYIAGLCVVVSAIYVNQLYLKR